MKAPDKKWTDLQEAHELYCAGHLMEAACAYYEATGKDRFLKLMEKNGNCIYRRFMEACPRGFSGHPEIELALMRLYRATGNEKYKELCAHFIDVRGQEPNYFIEEQKTRGWNVWGNDSLDTDYTQSTKPVREQKDAVGHAVRAVYLYTGMADLAKESGDESLKAACKTLWDSITKRRMYVTGASAPPSSARPSPWTTTCPTPRSTPRPAPPSGSSSSPGACWSWSPRVSTAT